MDEFNEQLMIDINRMFAGYVCYLFSSALGLYIEPKEYGPMRLLFAGEKVIKILDKINFCDNYLRQLLVKINKNKEFLLQDDETLKRFLEEESKNLAAYLSSIQTV